MHIDEMILVSVDDHVVEPRDMFERHVSPAYKARAPRIVKNRHGDDMWEFEGQLRPNVGLNAVAGRPPEEYGYEPTGYDQMRRGCFDVHARVRDMNVNGVLASMWRPLADKLAGWHRRGPDSAVDTAPSPRRTPIRLRSVVVLNALGVALLGISAIAKAADPLPIQLATPLATYLGARYLAQDVRAQMNLDLATGAIQDYRAEHGSYTGLDAAAGEFLVPQLDWSDRQAGEELTVTVATASHDLVQLVVRSGSGEVYCLQAYGPAAVLTLGSAHRSVPQARASCAAAEWSPDSIPAFDVAVLCEGVDPGGLPICRSAQDLFRTTIATPTAN